MAFSFESENLTAEKIGAMKRFERRRKLWKFFPVVEAFVAVLVLLSWLTPQLSAVKLAGEYIRKLSGGFSGGVFVFAVVNVLVAVIFYLSNLQKKTQPGFCGQCVSSAAANVNVNVHTVTPDKTETTRSVGEQANGAVKPDEGALTREMTVLPRTAVECDGSFIRGETNGAVEFDGGGGRGVRSRREMVRTASSVAGRRGEVTVSPLAAEGQVYRRSASERLDRRRISRRWREIDDLSSEEFRTTVETFIAGKRKIMSSPGKFHVSI